MTYKEILQHLKAKGIKNNFGNEITMNQLKVAIFRMEERHPNCKWRSELEAKKYHYVIGEGIMWLEKVYFNSDKKSIDSEIDFFEKRILWHEKFCNSNNIFYSDFKFRHTSNMTKKSKKYYLETLEERKMELTKICMKAGLSYNDFKLMN